TAFIFAIVCKSYNQKGTYIPVIPLMRFAVINPLGVNRPFPHHFRNACLASSLLIAKGITFRGAKEPDKRSPSTTLASPTSQVVPVVSASVMTSAPQFSQ